MGADPQGAPGAHGGIRSDQFSGLLMLVLALYVGWENRVYPVGTLAEPGPGYLPLVLAVFLGVTGALIAAWGHRSAPLTALKWNQSLRAGIILAACAAAAFGLERIGYRLTVIVLLLFFLGVLERRHPVPAALVALGFSFASFYVVGDLLHVPLPRSPWGF